MGKAGNGKTSKRGCVPASVVEAFFEASSSGLAIVDPELRFLHVNPALAQLCAASPAAFAGRTLREVIPALAPVLERAARQAFDTGRSVTGVQVSGSLAGAPNEVCHWLGNVLPIREDGVVVAVGISAIDNSARVRAEEDLRNSEIRFRELAENIDAAFWITSPDYATVYYLSPGFERILGRKAEDLMPDGHAFLTLIHPEDRPKVVALMAQAGHSFEIEWRSILPNGAVRWISDRGFPIRDEAGVVVRQAGICTDITRQKALEAQLRQSQRLDSIGRLAGGVAHDFNNLLTVILGQAALAASAIERNALPSESISEIHHAAMRAADLTGQLLAFARRQVTRPARLDLNDVARGLDSLLGRLLGESVVVVMKLAPDLGVVRADPTQVEQILVNLAVNAREAMPDGGRLTIETANVLLDEGSAAAKELLPGPHAMISVTDTGRGIPETDRPYVFEPFFTTKATSEGTGLGLSTCYGIIKQHGGHIALDSQVGGGTTVRAYLPRIDCKIPPRAPKVEPKPPRGSERVLVVEDDPQVRAVAVQTLKEHGFEVLEARDGFEALRAIESGNETVDIVVSDVVMPNMGGFELARRLETSHPDLRVIYTSGYTHDPATSQTARGARGALLQKPYLPLALVRHVRDAIDERASAKGG